MQFLHVLFGAKYLGFQVGGCGRVANSKCSAGMNLLHLEREKRRIEISGLSTTSMTSLWLQVCFWMECQMTCAQRASAKITCFLFGHDHQLEQLVYRNQARMVCRQCCAPGERKSPTCVAVGSTPSENSKREFR